MCKPQDYYGKYYTFLDGDLENEGLEFILDNTEYVKVNKIHMKYLFHRYLSHKIFANISSQHRENDKSVYINELSGKLDELEDTFRFKNRYYKPHDRNETEQKHELENVCYLDIKTSGENDYLTFIPLLHFRYLGYAVLEGASETKLRDGITDYGVDAIIYMSDTVKRIQKEFNIGGFFVDELSLLRIHYKEFDKKKRISQVDNEIILFEAEPNRKKVFDTYHGIRQIETKLETGMANKGYISYPDYGEGIKKCEVRERLHNKKLVDTIGIINYTFADILPPKSAVPITDERVRRDLESRLKYYLLCNFNLSELFDMAGDIKNNWELNDCLMKLKVEDIIRELKRVLGNPP